jgi:hypothetical protein
MNDEFEDHDGCNFHVRTHHKTNSKNGPKQSNCSAIIIIIIIIMVETMRRNIPTPKCR